MHEACQRHSDVWGYGNKVGGKLVKAVGAAPAAINTLPIED